MAKALSLDDSKPSLSEICVMSRFALAASGFGLGFASGVGYLLLGIALLSFGGTWAVPGGFSFLPSSWPWRCLAFSSIFVLA